MKQQLQELFAGQSHSKAIDVDRWQLWAGDPTHHELKSCGFMLRMECDVSRRRQRRRRAIESSDRRRRSVQILSYCQKIRCRRFGVEFHGRFIRRSHPATKMS